MRSKALKAQEDHLDKVSHLQEEKAIEVDCLIRENAAKVEVLQLVLKKEK